MRINFIQENEARLLHARRHENPLNPGLRMDIDRGENW